jgi:hypothetical protein
MDMLGHEYVAEDVELVALTKLFEDIEECGTRMVVVEIWQSTVAAESDEVEMALSLITLETARHRRMVLKFGLCGKGEGIVGFLTG